MKEIGIREARERFSELVAEVEAGETIAITRRGRPVMELTPSKAPRKISPHLAKLIAEGRARPGNGSRTLPPRVRLKGPGPSVSDYVIEDRR